MWVKMRALPLATLIMAFGQQNSCEELVGKNATLANKHINIEKLRLVIGNKVFTYGKNTNRRTENYLGSGGRK